MTIYLDNHATTRVDPRVLAAMLPYFSEHFGNAGSVVHAYGERAREAVADSRRAIAAAIGASPEEIVFTSGATESNNLAIRGVAERQRRRGDHLVSVATEHRAVLDPLARLGRRGYDVTLLDVAPHGRREAGLVDVEQFAAALRDDTVLASVMLANNEIGVVQPIAELAAACRAAGVLLHCDATQAVGKLPVDVQELGVDLMSFSAHKIYGPKGVGALYVRRTRPAVRLDAQISGGGQEHGLRSGTLNVPGIVGLAAAVSLCQLELSDEMSRQTKLRNRLWQRLSAGVAGVELCGPALDAVDAAGTPLRLPGNLDVAFGDVDGEALMLAMPDVAVSSGAACSSTDPAPSHVLLALGMTEDAARSTLRFGLGRFTTESDVEMAADAVIAAVAKLRGLAR
ncbi:MAG: IscS subfamily cysteine desulfurase [Planctomycetaceae bacterium]|nr:IscS subfamily cysteine desulfurase [Planctomycetaceae bacterium]